MSQLGAPEWVALNPRAASRPGLPRAPAHPLPLSAGEDVAGSCQPRGCASLDYRGRTGQVLPQASCSNPALAAWQPLPFYCIPLEHILDRQTAANPSPCCLTLPGPRHHPSLSFPESLPVRCAHVARARGPHAALGPLAGGGTEGRLGPPRLLCSPGQPGDKSPCPPTLA